MRVLKFRLVSVLLLAAPSALAQSNYAVVTGAVKDPQHLPVAAASISFKALTTEEIRRVVTNEQGLFEGGYAVARRI